MNRSTTGKERHLAQRLTGRKMGSQSSGANSVLFRPITLISLIFIGFFAFGALIVLSGFASDFRKAPPGQATPRSVSAVGYKALTNYLADIGYDVRETRGKREQYDRKNRLVVYTPSRPTRRLTKIMEAEGDAVNLVILPKWSVTQLEPREGEVVKKGWVRKTSNAGLNSINSYRVLQEDLPVLRRHDAPSPDSQLSFKAPHTYSQSKNYQPDFKDLQYFDLTLQWTDYRNQLMENARLKNEENLRRIAEENGETYEPQEKKENTSSVSNDVEENDETPPKPLPKHDILLEIDGKAVLIQLEGTQTYILSEPDLVNTMAFKSQGGAYLTNVIIDTITHAAFTDAMAVDFDVSLHGIETNRNIIKLMVTPPFLAATLCLLTAGGLVGWQGFNRFGDPSRSRPDYAQGPVSLAQTAAEFMGVANRAHKTGEAYAALIRRQVATELAYKSRAIEDIDILLNAREERLNIQPTFVDLTHAISNADIISYGQHAQALTGWRTAMTRTDFLQDSKKS